LHISDPSHDWLIEASLSLSFLRLITVIDLFDTIAVSGELIDLSS
jgi:hypothetical protein